jgi:tRNA 2-thiouridine synthesizing protein A
MTTHYDKELDASGLSCPMPILKTKKTLSDMGSGETLHVIATDPGSVKDFEAFARHTGHVLVETGETDGKFHFYLKKA